jgi:hypothetical protein
MLNLVAANNVVWACAGKVWVIVRSCNVPNQYVGLSAFIVSTMLSSVVGADSPCTSQCVNTNYREVAQCGSRPSNEQASCVRVANERSADCFRTCNGVVPNDPAPGKKPVMK